MKTFKQAQSVIITAKVTRADGTVEDLGQVGAYTRSWWKTFLHKIQKGLPWARE